jgi:hypothetical protein
MVEPAQKPKPEPEPAIPSPKPAPTILSADPGKGPGSGVDVVYVVALRDDCWYLGRTSRLERRMAELAANATRNAWLVAHPVLPTIRQPFEYWPCTDATMEDAKTVEWMHRYGIDRVRGGSFVKRDLDEAQRRVLLTMMASAGNMCFRCGSKSHYAAACHSTSAPSTTPAPKKPTAHDELVRTAGRRQPPPTSPTSLSPALVRKRTDTRAGVVGARAAVVAGAGSPGGGGGGGGGGGRKDRVGRGGLRGGRAAHHAKKHVVQAAGACFRCGRTSHWAADCYASTHVDGREIVDVEEESSSDDD